jgi:hypothetical protein
MTYTRHIARLGKNICTYKVWARKLEGQRSLEKPRLRWEDKFKIDIKEEGLENVDWINLAHNRG